MSNIFADLKAATLSLLDAGAAVVSVTSTAVKDSADFLAVSIPATKEVVVAITDVPRNAYEGYVMDDQNVDLEKAKAIVSESWDKTFAESLAELARFSGEVASKTFTSAEEGVVVEAAAILASPEAKKFGTK